MPDSNEPKEVATPGMAEETSALKVLACSSNTITAGQLATNWDSQETKIFFGKSNSRKIEDARYRANKSIWETDERTKMCYKML